MSGRGAVRPETSRFSVNVSAIKAGASRIAKTIRTPARRTELVTVTANVTKNIISLIPFGAFFSVTKITAPSAA